VAEGFADDSTGFAREIDLSYRGQQWVVRVALDEGDGFDADDARHRFEAEYDRLYGHIQPGGTIEITNVRIVGIGRLPSADLGVGGTASAAAEPVASRRVFVDAATGWQQVPVYAAGDLLPGHRLTGPLVIEARTTTVLAGADDRLEVDAAGNFMIHIASGSPP
jgi:N-methylhydantoinase A